MARNLSRSAGIPMFHVSAQLNVDPLRKAAGEGNISLTLLLARAAALTVTAHPLFNAAFTAEGLALRERVDVGIAVETKEGLIAPVVRDAARRSLAELADDWRDLRAKAQNRRLRPEAYRGATFYLSNLGMFPAVYEFNAVLPLGAAAILCVGASRDGRALFTLGCDHRVVAGADAARFLQSFEQILCNPAALSGGEIPLAGGVGSPRES
jgi:pyruvate dehydrogenase E2 component (dihydrolipoamide acetyltransferase)